MARKNVSIKEICCPSGHRKATVVKLLSSARDLPPNIVPEHKIIADRPRKTTEGTNKLLKHEVMKNPCVNTCQHKADNPKV